MEHYRDSHQKELAARNPNTPPDTLLDLAQSCPRAFLENPVIPLLLLENPNFLHFCSPGTAEALLGCKRSPEWVFYSLAFHPNQEVRHLVAINSHTPLSLLDVLRTDKDSYVRGGVAHNVKTPLAWLALLATDRRVLFALALHGKERRLLDVLAPDKDGKTQQLSSVAVRYAIAIDKVRGCLLPLRKLLSTRFR